jgi:TPR repeat protein
MHGLFVAQDDAIAIHHFRRAHDLGHADAAVALARAYHARLDLQNARHWCQIALANSRLDERFADLFADSRWWRTVDE